MVLKFVHIFLFFHAVVFIMSTARRVGLDIFFTDVRILVHVSVTPITKGTLAQIFFGKHVFPQGIGLCFLL